MERNIMFLLQWVIEISDNPREKEAEPAFKVTI